MATNNAQGTYRYLDGQRLAREAGEEWNYGSGHNFRKTQSLELALIRTALSFRLRLLWLPPLATSSIADFGASNAASNAQPCRSARRRCAIQASL